MTLFVLWEDRPVSIEREITESDANFALRIEFFLYALDQGIPIERAHVLAHCYLNKRLYGSRYMTAIETQIQLINVNRPQSA